MTFIKYITVFLSFTVLSGSPVSACNGGCPAGGGYLGIVPQFSRNFAGLRYRMRTFSQRPTENISSSYSKHRFETVEAWGRFYPSERIQAFVFVPFQMNTEQAGDKVYSEGVGDISFIFNYQVINTGDSLDYTWKHSLLLGTGAKLPTGKYQQRNTAKQMFPITFQPGTGAYSAIFSSIYTVRHNKTGLNTNLSYYYNGTNELGYSFGNMTTANASLFYWIKAGKVSFLPSLGYYLEHTDKDIDNGYYVRNTGGAIHYGNAGIDVYISRLALSLNVQSAFVQNLPFREQKDDLRLISSAVWLF